MEIVTLTDCQDALCADNAVRTRRHFFGVNEVPDTLGVACRLFFIVLCVFGVVSCQSKPAVEAIEADPDASKPLTAFIRAMPGDATMASGETQGVELVRNVGEGNDGVSSDRANPVRGWSIVLLVVREGREAAEGVARRYRAVAGLEDAVVQDRIGASLVTVGDYPSAESREAVERLKSVKALDVGGDRPFASAMLFPPPEGAVAGAKADRNLSNVRRAMRDPSASAFTLQIAVYKRPDGGAPSEQERGEFVSAAEKAADELRAKGEDAFYYHGPTESSVTIGLFSEGDLPKSSEGRTESEPLRRAKEAHPYLLMNGAGMKVRVKGSDTWVMQPSILVSVPK